jgi:hypothetical protein
VANVGELVGDDDADLIVREALEQCVEQDDALGRPETGDTPAASASARISERICPSGSSVKVLKIGSSTIGASVASRPPNSTEPPVAGIHQALGQRPIAAVAAAPPAPEAVPWIAVAFTRSIDQSRQLCVASPTASARRRARAASGRPGSERETASPAPIAAPATKPGVPPAVLERRSRSGVAEVDRRRARATIAVSVAASSRARAAPIARWPRA